MRYLLFASFMIKACFCIAQVENEKPTVLDLPIPTDLEKCFQILDQTMDAATQAIVKTLPEDSIYYHRAFHCGAEFYYAWNLPEGSAITQYLNGKGIFGLREIYETILISYHRHLNDTSVDLEGQIKHYKAKKKAEYAIYLSKLDKDTLDGIYIPKDLEDCFIQLDKILSSEERSAIKLLKHKSETAQYQLHIGLWVRNNWGLWSGSRLQKYLQDRKLTTPDAMSVLILEYYYDWLNNKPEDWKKWAQ